MHGGREPGDFDYLWAGKKGTTMIKGAIFDMDGTLVDNTPVHIRAFEIFCERYGIRDWKEKLGQAYGLPRPWGCLRRNASSSKTPRRGSKQHAEPGPDISWRWPRRSTAQR